MGASLKPLTSEARVHLCPSIECPPELEIKILLCHFKYTFFSEHNTLPVIVTVDLIEAEEGALLLVLKVHREATSSTIVDIEEISPSII